MYLARWLRSRCWQTVISNMFESNWSKNLMSLLSRSRFNLSSSSKYAFRNYNFFPATVRLNGTYSCRYLRFKQTYLCYLKTYFSDVDKKYVSISLSIYDMYCLLYICDYWCCYSSKTYALNWFRSIFDNGVIDSC